MALAAASRRRRACARLCYTVQKLNPLSMTDALVVALRDEILGGELAPGTQLPEGRLATRFGVARPTVRTAVQTLLHEGLLRREPNRTAYIPRLTEEDVRDLYLVRTPLELHAVGTLIERDVRPIVAEQAIERLEAGGTEGASWTAIVDAALGFHRGLIDAVGSPRLERAYRSLEGELRLCFAQLKQGVGGLPPDRTVEHRQIFDGIVRRDAERTIPFLRKHLEGGTRLSMGFR